MDEVPENKIQAANFSCIVFFLLDFLTLEGETDWLFQNVGKDLPLYTA
jgi:hypothetical protein